MVQRTIRIMVAKVGLDGHDRGAKVICSLLKEAGMEVVYLGMYQIPKDVIDAAIDEDADVIGPSFAIGRTSRLHTAPRGGDEKGGLDDVLLIAGGVIPAEDIPTFKEMGLRRSLRPAR